MRRWISIGWLALASTAGAQTDEAFDNHLELDPVELARTVDALGDDIVLEGLSDDVTVAAIRAAPYMAAPELALAPLVEIAAGRDPWLAPLAMMSVLEIADGPVLIEMPRREPDDLAPVLEALAAMAADETVRTDLRAAAALASGQLAPAS